MDGLQWRRGCFIPTKREVRLPHQAFGKKEDQLH